MKRKIIILFFVIFVLLLGYYFINRFFFKSEMSKQEIIELLNKPKNHKTIYIKSKKIDEYGNITNTETFIEGNIELHKYKYILDNQEIEKVTWYNKDTNERIDIDENSKTYSKTNITNYKYVDYSDYDYEFVNYETYDNIKCVVVDFTHKDISNDRLWIDLKSGNILKRTRKINEYSYTEYIKITFDNTETNNFIKPDLSEYKLIDHTELETETLQQIY